MTIESRNEIMRKYLVASLISHTRLSVLETDELKKEKAINIVNILANKLISDDLSF